MLCPIFTSIHVGLDARLANGGTMIVAEGYLLELERRGYMKGGPFVPEVVLDHPEVVRQVHEEFVHAGSDVVLAFTVSYYDRHVRLRYQSRKPPEIVNADVGSRA